MIKFWMFSFVLLGHESVNANGWQYVKEYIYIYICMYVCMHVCIDNIIIVLRHNLIFLQETQQN